MRRMKKFSQGGRAEAARDRRMADIEKDYKIALAKGKSEKEARAKRDQRIADAKDDYAKRTGGDRTETRAAEKAAEARLTAARRGVDKDIKPLNVTREGSKPLATAKMDAPKVDTPKVETSSGKQTFAQAFAAARKSGAKTFTWNGGSYTTEMRGEKKPAAPARASAPTRAAPAAPADKPVRYAANFGAVKPKPKPPAEPKSVGRRMAETSAKRQQGFFDQLGSELSAPFRKARAAGSASDKARGYAKGGKVDGAAIRGKTRAMRKK